MARHSHEFIKRLRLRHRGYIALLTAQVIFLLLLPVAEQYPAFQSALNIALAAVILGLVSRYTQIKRLNSLFYGVGIFAIVLEALWRLSLEILPTLGHWLTLLHVFVWLLFYFTSILRLIKSLIREPYITVAVVMASVEGYLLIGVAGGVLMTAVLEMHPAAFDFNTLTNGYMDHDLLSTPNAVSLFSPVLMAASFNLLTTVGSGVINSGDTTSQVVVTIITVSGQLYVAILIALILGRSHSR